MIDRKSNDILSTTSRFCPSGGPRALFLSVIPKTGKPWNLFSPISLVNYHFFSFSLVSYHFFSKMICSNIDVALNEHQLSDDNIHIYSNTS
jgi:hypothetical protein